MISSSKLFITMYLAAFSKKLAFKTPKQLISNSFQYGRQGMIIVTRIPIWFVYTDIYN